MEDLNDKITGDSLTADDWNQPASEIQTVIEDTSQTLNGGDLAQLSKAISAYSATADFYVCSGTANDYTLTTIGDYKGPQFIREGMRFRFYPNINGINSTAEITLPGSLGTKDVVRPDGIAFLADEDFNTDEMAEVVYRLSSDRLELRTRNSSNTANSSSVSGFRITDALNTLNTLFANIDTDDIDNVSTLNGGGGTLTEALDTISSGGDSQRGFVSSDRSNATAAYIDLTDLNDAAALVSGEDYLIESEVIVFGGSPANSGIDLKFDFSASDARLEFTYRQENNSDFIGKDASSTSSIVLSLTDAEMPNVVPDRLMSIRGHIRANSNGNLGIQFKRNNASGTVIIREGSWLKVTKV